jgi:hypothetical protein
VVPHHEEAPISLCPQLIDEINVDLTPFKKLTPIKKPSMKRA